MRQKLAGTALILGCGLVLALVTPCLRSQSVAALPKLDKKSLTGSWYEIARLPYKREKHCAADAIELIALADKPAQLQLVDACTDVKGYKDSWNFAAFDKDGSGALKVRTLFPFKRKYWLLAVGPVVPLETPSPPVQPTVVPSFAGTGGSGASGAPATDATDAADAATAAIAASAPNMPAAEPPPSPPPSLGYAWTLIGTPNHKSLWIYARTPTLSAQDLDRIKAIAGAQGFDPAKLVTSPQSAH